VREGVFVGRGWAKGKATRTSESLTTLPDFDLEAGMTFCRFEEIEKVKEGSHNAQMRRKTLLWPRNAESKEETHAEFE